MVKIRYFSYDEGIAVFALSWQKNYPSEFFEEIRLKEDKSTAELYRDVDPYLVYLVRLELDPVRRHRWKR